MANINQNPSHRARYSYQGFDLSQYLKFSSAVGHLLPVYQHILNAGDKVTCQSFYKTISNPLLSPAMFRLEENFDWFFVPLEQLYSPFGSFEFGVNDIRSSLINNSVSSLNSTNRSKFPTATLGDLSDLLQVHFKSDASSWLSETGSNMARLFEHLGYSLIGLLTNTDGTNGNAAVIQRRGMTTTPWFALAYQKIYNDYFRQDDFEANDPSSYNLDHSIGGTISSTYLNKIFALHSVMKKRDFFLNIKPSPLFNSESIGGLGASSIFSGVSQWLSGLQTSSLRSPSSNQSPSGQATSNLITPTTVGLPSVSSPSAVQILNQFNVSNIRTIFATEKIAQLARFAKKTYSAQQLARMGVSIPEGIHGDVYHIGGESNPMNVGTVVSTADTSNAPIGELAGKAFGDNTQGNEPRKFKFTAPVKGVLMCVYYARPEIDYWQEGSDKLNHLVTPNDFYRPEYDNLGMQPLFMYQRHMIGTSGATDNFTPDTVIGWQYRYYEFKQKINRTIGALAGDMYFWAPASHAKSSGIPQSSTLFQVVPNYLNPVYVYQYLGYTPNANVPASILALTWAGLNSASENKTINGITQSLTGSQWLYNQIFSRDPLVHEVYFKVRLASSMDTYGLPST